MANKKDDVSKSSVDRWNEGAKAVERKAPRTSRSKTAEQDDVEEKAASSERSAKAARVKSSKAGSDKAAKAKPSKAKAGSAKRRPRLGANLTKEARRYVSTLVILAVFCVVCVFVFTPLSERITTGLDIQGGVSVIMTASNSDGSAVSTEDMTTATNIIQQRVNSLGASEATVQRQGTNSILVQIPGATDAQSAVDTIGKTGKLEFVRLDAIGDADALAELQAGKENVQLKAGTYEAFMTGDDIESSSVSQSNGTKGYVVDITLDAEGTKKFADVTKELVATNGQIAIVLDGVVNSAPAVQSEITTGQVQISGNYTATEAKALKTVLDSGSLPVTLSYSESRVVGPTLGQDSLHQAVVAIAVGICIVAVYLFFFYQGLGILTFGSLAVFEIIYLGILATLSHYGAFALSLPGLAGMVLTTGSAADSSILVLERFREEIRMGRTVRNASLTGVKHGIGTSVDADVVTLVSALALFFIAVGQVKGFGLTLALGIVCDLITMYCFKAPAIRLLARGTFQKNPKFWGIAGDLEEAAQKADPESVKGGVANA